MGTSQVALAPRKGWKKVTTAMLDPKRNATSIINTAMTAALPIIPSGHISVPVCYAVSEGIRFAADVQERGLDSALRRKEIRPSEKFVATSISNGVWRIVASKVDNKFINSPFGKLAEGAFKKTMSTIMREGAKALEE